MKLRHPSRSVLQDWLTGEIEATSTAGVERHLDVCARCAATLEALEPQPESRIGDALAIVLAPPADLAQRLEQGVAAKLSSRQMMEVVADLFGAGLETTRLLLIEDPDDNR
jgi:anti-sigma factor RsiW